MLRLPAVSSLVSLVLLFHTASRAQVAAPTTVLDQAVTYQINTTHTGAHNTTGLVPPLAIKWSVNLGATVSYPLIAGGRVFVLAGNGTVNDVSLYALDAQTGATIWGPIIVPNGAYWWAAAAYDNGKIFVVPDASVPFGQGSMFAYDAATGNLLWTANLTFQYLYSSPPTARNGIVYTGGAGSGGTVFAVNETNGSVLWTAGVANGDNSSPAVTGTGVFVSYVCPNVYDFAPKTGKSLWSYSPGCDGGGGATPVLYGGNLYVRDAIVYSGYNGGVFQASNGTLLSNFNSEFAPAFANGIGLYTNTDSITAFNVTTNATVWTAAPAAGDSYSTAPIIVNGVAYVGTSQGELIGYGLYKGKKRVSMGMGASISGSDYYFSFSAPISGLSAAQGLLLVPASNTLVALYHP
jgi:outer membrane protein assembly factor BamB